MLNTVALIQVLVGALVLLVAVFVLVQRALGRARRKRPTMNGNVLDVMDEVFAPSRHAAALELQARENQGPVTPTSDDSLPPTRDGVYVHVRRKRASSPRSRDQAG